MNFSFLSSFFLNEHTRHLISDSVLLQKLKSINSTDSLLFYENITIFHHSYSFYIPLLILDPLRGIYILEYKTWSFNDLKDVKIEKATEVNSLENTLAYEKAHNIIRQKFNEIIHNDGVPIYNYLLMENLTLKEYNELSLELHDFLPEQKILFKNSSDTVIINKLQSIVTPIETLPNPSIIIGTLLTQYTLLDKDTNLQLCTKEQRKFIDSDILEHITLNSSFGRGKTEVILLKSIFEKLKNPVLKVVIIKPTRLSCELLQKKLLETIEHSIVEVDLSSIEIITPLELINKHLQKLSKPLLKNELIIDSILLEKKIDVADLILCDDADFIGQEFILYLKHIQDKNSLIIVSEEQNQNSFTLSKNFLQNKKLISFIHTNPHAKAIQLISKLLNTKNANEILVVANSFNKEKLAEDLESFIEDKAIILDSSKSLLEQDFDSIRLSTYDDIIDLEVKYIILMDIESTNTLKLNYAFNLAQKEVYILYEEESQNLIKLKEKYENH